MKTKLRDRKIGIAALAWLVFAFGIAATSSASVAESATEHGGSESLLANEELVRQSMLRQVTMALTEKRSNLQTKLLTEMKPTVELQSAANTAE